MGGKIVKIVIIAFILLAVCSIFLFIPNSPGANGQEDIARGQALYKNHCGDCHRLYMPEEFTTEQWRHFLDIMQINAKISDEQKELIYKYLASGAKQ